MKEIEQTTAPRLIFLWKWNPEKESWQQFLKQNSQCKQQKKKTLIFTSSKRLTSNVKSVSPSRSPDSPPLSPITQFLLVNDYAAWRNHIWLTYPPGPSQVQAYKSYKIKREKKKRYKYVNEYLRLKNDYGFVTSTGITFHFLELSRACLLENVTNP